MWPRRVPFSGLFFDLPPLIPLAIALRLVLDRRLTCLFDHLLAVFKTLPGLTIQHSDELAVWLRHRGNPRQLRLHEDLPLHFQPPSVLHAARTHCLVLIVLSLGCEDLSAESCIVKRGTRNSRLWDHLAQTFTHLTDVIEKYRPTRTTNPPIRLAYAVSSRHHLASTTSIPA